MKKYLVGTIFLLVVLVGTSFAKQVPTIKSIPKVDTTPPVLNITSPKDGSTVSGLFTISATATDNVAVTKVGFCVEFPNSSDYYCYPGGDTSAPYEVSMDSRAFPDGSNSIRVIAYDTAGHVTNKYATVLIENAEETDPPPIAPPPETVKNIYLDNGGPGDGSIGNPYGKFSEIPWSSIQSWVNSGYAVNINLKRGVTWTGQPLPVAASGTASNRITIQPYGSGADPIIDGTGSGVDVTVRLDQRSYVTVDGLELKNGQVRNISFYGPGVGNILQNCNIHSEAKGPFVYNQTDLIIQKNSIHDIGTSTGHGIYLTGGTSQKNIIVQYNDIYNVYLHGIQINANGDGYIKDTIIRYNKIHGLRSGINENGGLRSQIYGNLFYDLSDFGIVFFVNVPYTDYTYTAKDALVYNNTFYMPGGGECIRVNHRSNGHTIKNNIFYKGSDYDPCKNVISGSENLQASDNNLFHKTSGTFSIYQGISYSNLTNFQNGTPFDDNSKNSNPLFKNAGSDDFTLTSGSPARTNAERIPGYDQRLSPLSSWPDNVILMTSPDSIGAYGY